MPRACTYIVATEGIYIRTGANQQTHAVSVALLRGENQRRDMVL